MLGTLGGLGGQGDKALRQCWGLLGVLGGLQSQTGAYWSSCGCSELARRHSGPRGSLVGVRLGVTWGQGVPWVSLGLIGCLLGPGTQGRYQPSRSCGCLGVSWAPLYPGVLLGGCSGAGVGLTGCLVGAQTRRCSARTQWVLGGCLVLLSILWVPGSWGLRVCRVSALGAVPPSVPPELLRDAPASGPGQAFSFSSLASPCWLCTSSCARPLLWPRPFRWCLPLPASGSCLAPHALGIAASPG